MLMMVYLKGRNLCGTIFPEFNFAFFGVNRDVTQRKRLKCLTHKITSILTILANLPSYREIEFGKKFIFRKFIPAKKNSLSLREITFPQNV